MSYFIYLDFIGQNTGTNSELFFLSGFNLQNGYYYTCIFSRFKAEGVNFTFMDLYSIKNEMSLLRLTPKKKQEALNLVGLFFFNYL